MSTSKYPLQRYENSNATFVLSVQGYFSSCQKLHRQLCLPSTSKVLIKTEKHGVFFFFVTWPVADITEIT